MRKTIDISQAVMPEANPPNEPAWAVATLFPSQGGWSEQDYLLLPTNRPVELSEGNLEVLAMPTRMHQLAVAFLYEALAGFVRSHKLGQVFFAALPVRLWAGKFREPDVIFVQADNTDALQGKYLHGADLVMEVVSSDDPDRDWIVKRAEYARAGIAEYWIADAMQRRIVVFTLQGTSYAVHGEYGDTQSAQSPLLPGFTVNVAALWAHCQS